MTSASSMVLHFHLDLPLTEAATILDIPVGTAKSRLHRGLAAMRTALGAEPARELGSVRERPASASAPPPQKEEEDPNQVDEVPEQPRVLDAIREVLLVFLPELGAGPPEVGVDRHPAHDVEHVQPGHREVDREEGVRARKIPVVELRRILEYLTTRKTAPKPTVAAMYQRNLLN